MSAITPYAKCIVVVLHNKLNDINILLIITYKTNLNPTPIVIINDPQ